VDSRRQLMGIEFGKLPKEEVKKKESKRLSLQKTFEKKRKRSSLAKSTPRNSLLPPPTPPNFKKSWKSRLQKQPLTVVNVIKTQCINNPQAVAELLKKMNSRKESQNDLDEFFSQIVTSTSVCRRSSMGMVGSATLPNPSPKCTKPKKKSGTFESPIENKSTYRLTEEILSSNEKEVFKRRDKIIRDQTPIKKDEQVSKPTIVRSIQFE